MTSPVYNFLVLNFYTQGFHPSVGGAPLFENWILEGDEQGSFSVNAFVFICIVFGLNFLGAKL